MMDLPLAFVGAIAAVSFGCSLLSATALCFVWKRLTLWRPRLSFECFSRLP